ncbi:MAG: hypothetical protein N2422_01875 [Rhodobacteraceae bacterium]|nr:hypothetical protein [Paracoccaceae bacterium]
MRAALSGLSALSARSAPAAVLAVLAAAPAPAEGRHDPVLDCTFGTESVSVLQDGDGFRIAVGGQTFPAVLARPGPVGRVVGIFAMLDAGPVMIAVQTTRGQTEHMAEILASTEAKGALATRSTRGTCTEATP